MLPVAGWLFHSHCPAMVETVCMTDSAFGADAVAADLHEKELYTFLKPNSPIGPHNRKLHTMLRVGRVVKVSTTVAVMVVERGVCPVR